MDIGKTQKHGTGDARQGQPWADNAKQVEGREFYGAQKYVSCEPHLKTLTQALFNQRPLK